MPKSVCQPRGAPAYPHHFSLRQRRYNFAPVYSIWGTQGSNKQVPSSLSSEFTVSNLEEWEGRVYF